MSTPMANSTQIRTYRSFEDLEVYKTAGEFRKAMYKAAKTLPDFEKFGLAVQMRRAALSLTNNLAEGHGRFHFLDQIKFVLISRGSLEELMDDLNVCLDENYLPAAQVEKLKTSGWHLLKLTNGYLRYLRDRKLGSSLEMREGSAPYSTSECDESMEWLEKLLEENPDLISEQTRSPLI